MTTEYEVMLKIPTTRDRFKSLFLVVALRSVNNDVHLLDMIEEIMEVFMDYFLVYGNTFDHCLENLDRVLQWCQEKHLILNWEKCHFMV